MTHWTTLIAKLGAEYPPLEEEWVFGGKQWGWSLRLKQKKRAILYMTPGRRFFHVGFALGEKAVRAAHEARLPAALLATIDSAQKFAEGRAVRLEMKTRKDLEHALQLAAIKMEN